MESLAEILFPIALFGGLFVCSLFVCKTWISRVLFTIVTPVVYGFVWFVSLVVIGCIAMVMPAGLASILDYSGFGIAIGISFVVFVIHMVVMSKDSAMAGTNHFILMPGRKGKNITTSALPHIVTQRRITRR